MKVFIKILVLILSIQTYVKADDCFAVENICLGDSALDYFSKKELKDSEYFYYSDKRFVTSILNNHPNFKKYETIELDYRKSDKKYKILYINGIIFFKNKKIDKCLNLQEEVVNDIKKSFDVKPEYSEGVNSTDIEGKSFFYQYAFNIDGEFVISVECYDWSKRMQSKFTNNITVSVSTKKFSDFQNTGVYKEF